MKALFPPPGPILARISGTHMRFPVRRIYCVGRNYAAHAREMGMDERDPPFFFTKFADTLMPSGSVLRYPERTSDYQFEGELVLAIGSTARAVPVEAALDHVYGYACGLDMTRRDLQLAARDKGRPWDMGKNFSQAAVLGDIVRAEEMGELAGRMLRLRVNGVVRQETDLALLIWSCTEIISELSQFDTLEPGDLVYTGTPAGVGAVLPGDSISLSIDGLPQLDVTIG
jgi:fumarylpyruvate hydrolase